MAEKKFAQHCPECGRYMKIEGHNFRGNDYLGMEYNNSEYFCGHCRLHVPMILSELAFKFLKE